MILLNKVLCINEREYYENRKANIDQDYKERKKIALELFKKYRDNAKKIHQLNYIFWECTLRCNLNCLHCGSDCKKESHIKDMPVTDFIAAIDDIKSIVNPNETIVVLTGGEPLLRNDIEICGKKLYERGFPWGIVSNGLNFSEKRLNSLIQSGLRALTVSLDGMEQTHNWLRANNTSFKKAVDAIHIAAKTPDLVFDVVTCIHPKNISELVQIKDLLLNNNVKSWRIFTIFPIGRAHQNKLTLSSADFKHLFDFIATEKKLKEIKLNYGCEGFLGNYEGEVRDNFFFCKAGINIASILIDGSISACPNNRGNFIQGNIYKDSFKEVWENKYKIFRNREWMKTGICADCNLFKYCDGNGMHLRNEKSGENIFCHYNHLNSIV